MVSILETPETTVSAPAKARTPGWVIALLAILSLLLVTLGITARSTRSRLTAQLSEANAKLAKLGTRATAMESNYAELAAQSKLAFERLGLTQQELDQARTQAQQLLQEQQEKLGAITGEVQTVKGEVAGHREAIEETRKSLQQAIGDLGEQSGLIASSRQELEGLKRLGEREYFDFDVAKSRDFSRVGPIGIKLKDADVKRNKFTLTLLADDAEIEKKDKTLLEPVQFYLRGSRQLREVVVYEISKNRVVGYLSVPKSEAPKAESAAAPQQ
jgi:cell division protein FtsB